MVAGTDTVSAVNETNKGKADEATNYINTATDKLRSARNIL